MEDSSSAAKLPPSSNDDTLELNIDLERMIENVENAAVQMTCMVYDMVTLRTSPEVDASMRELEDAYYSCRAAVCEDPDQQAELESCSAEPAATTLG